MNKADSRKRSRHPKISLQQLRHAVLAGDSGSFRQAAEAASVKQSTLSRSVRQLEHLVGGAIFERSRSGVRATESGQALLHLAKTVLEQMDNLAVTARMSAQGKLGRISIGFYTSLSTGNLRGTLIEYTKRFPDINIVMLEGSRTNLAAALRSRTIDVAIVTGDRPLVGSKSIPLWSERIVAILPEAHKLAARDAVSWTDLGNETLVLGQRDPGPAIQELLSAKITSPEDRPNIVSYDISGESVKSLISADFGISLTLEASLGANVIGVVHRELHDGVGLARIGLSASWREDNENPALANLLGLLRERFPSA
jgi:DNA-binding transcriptional LysR family regulator